MRTIFFGSSRQVVPILEALRFNTQLKLVVTTEAGSQETVPYYCKIHKISFISVRRAADLIENVEIMQQMAELGVVADFGLIIPEQTFKHFALGMVNIHPSLLPKYRGASPTQNAILNGEKKTGVTIIQLDKFVDHGPILVQEEEEIMPQDSAKDLYARLFKKGAQMLTKILPKIENQNLKLIQQDENQATYTKSLKRDDGFMSLAKMITEEELFERMVRAYYPWPGVWTEIKFNSNEKKKVKFLPENKIQVESGREMAYKDFINGYPNADKIFIDYLRSKIQ